METASKLAICYVSKGRMSQKLAASHHVRVGGEGTGRGVAASLFKISDITPSLIEICCFRGINPDHYLHSIGYLAYPGL
jgi:hypothetical protein